MPLYDIVEIDRDYRAYVGTQRLEFENLAAANAYCTKESWTGADYFVQKEVKSDPHQEG